MQSLAIEIHDLNVRLENRSVLSDINLKLRPGQKMTMTGRSGSGKTTLLNCLLGFVMPESGQIRISGQELNPYTIWQLRPRMAYVAQEPQMASGRVRELLARPMSFRCNRHLQSNLEKIPELFERLLLPAWLLDKETSALSGGERQRMALLAALLLDREILLLDEASSALDDDSRAAVIDLLRAQDDLTILSVSHDQKWLGLSTEVIEISAAEELV